MLHLFIDSLPSTFQPTLVVAEGLAKAVAVGGMREQVADAGHGALLTYWKPSVWSDIDAGLSLQLFSVESLETLHYNVGSL